MNTTTTTAAHTIHDTAARNGWEVRPNDEDSILTMKRGRVVVSVDFNRAGAVVFAGRSINGGGAADVLGARAAGKRATVMAWLTEPATPAPFAKGDTVVNLHTVTTHTVADVFHERGQWWVRLAAPYGSRPSPADHYTSPATVPTPARREFLTDILNDGVAFADYWCQEINGGYGPGVADVVEHDTDTRYTVTIETVARGLGILAAGGGNYRNSGYDRSSYGDTAARMALLDTTNGEDSDADALDYDAIIQLGLFGSVVYG